MGCTFIKNEQGEITEIRSDVFRQALDKYQDRQKAIDMTAVTLLEDFTEQPSLIGAETYIARENANTNPLTAQQTQDLKNMVMGNTTSIEDLYSKLQSAFYTGEIFAPTEQKLRNSGLYSPYEVQTIINDISLQERIKSSIEALKNTEVEDSQLENYFDLQTVKSNEFNSFGKLNNYNPYVVNTETINLLGGIQSEAEFYEQLGNLNYPTDVTFEQIQDYVRVQEMNDDLQPLKDNTYILLELKDAVTDSQNLENLQTLLTVPDTVIEQNVDQVRELLSITEEKMVSEGLDVIGLKEKALDPQLKPFLSGMISYLQNPSVENTQSFADIYNSFFNIDTADKYRALKLPQNRNYVYSETRMTDNELMENNLVKARPNIFIKVRRQPIENMYPIVSTYREGDLQQQVEQLTGEMSEEVVLWKMYLDLPMNISEEVDIEQQLENDTVFEGNFQYLQEEFPTVFYKEILKEKLRNSTQYKNFYSQFTINQNGIQLFNQDPITLDTVQTWIEEIKPAIANNLKQYSLISKQLPSLISPETNIVAKEATRALAVNYPNQITELSTRSTRIDNDNIIAMNATQEFIRVGQETYEAIETQNGMTLFSKLPVNNSNFNMYNIQRPVSEINLSSYTYLEKTGEIQYKDYLKKEKRTNINQENFDCL